MKLTAFADFGLRVLLVLGASERGVTWSSADLAARLVVSRDHLVKVIQRLAAGQFVQTVRGPGGGVRLARPPESIRIGDALAWLEEEAVLVDCFRATDRTCALLNFCALRPRLELARQAFYASLNECTVADCCNPEMRAFASTS